MGNDNREGQETHGDTTWGCQGLEWEVGLSQEKSEGETTGARSRGREKMKRGRMGQEDARTGWGSQQED